MLTEIRRWPPKGWQILDIGGGIGGHQRVFSLTFKDHGALVWIGEAETGRLISVLKQTCHDLGVGGGQLANVVFANVGRGAIFHTMGSRYKWQPASKLLLSGTTIGEEKNFVWEEPGVDLPQQFSRVLRHGIAGDEYLFRFSESKIESGSQGRHRVGVRLKTSRECGEGFLGSVAPLGAIRALCEAKQIHGGGRVGRGLGTVVGFPS